VSAVYAALLRQAGVDTIPVVRIYVTALGMIRALANDEESLSAQDKLTEIRAVLAGLTRVQEDLDAAES
jgi:hypothetical protein